MKIELDNEVLYQLKDAVMIEFLKNDVDTIKKFVKDYQNPDDVKYNKRLLKAYKRILNYYGEEND